MRLVLEGGGDHPTQWAERPKVPAMQGIVGTAAQGAINSVAAKIGCTAETLRMASAYFAMAELDRRSRT